MSSNSDPKKDVEDPQAGADKAKKQMELLQQIFDKVEKLQEGKNPGDFPTTQELNVPPAVADSKQIEIWKDILGYEGYYQVSNMGRVKSLQRQVARGNGYLSVAEKILMNCPSKSGHVKVTLIKSGKFDHRYVHRLVLEAFIGSCPVGMQCCHFPDQDPTNNQINNICWGSSKQNQAHRVIHGSSNRGEACATSKLTKDKVLIIRRLYKSGMYSQSTLGHKFKVSRTTISQIINYKRWSHI